MPGRIPAQDPPIPVMGQWLDEFVSPDGMPEIELLTPSTRALAILNEEAYGVEGFQDFLEPLDDPRVRIYGVKEDGAFVCVVMTLTVEDDVSIHYAATALSHRKRGLATALVAAVLEQAIARGVRSATLQASEEGLSVWRRLGFVQIGDAHA